MKVIRFMVTALLALFCSCKSEDKIKGKVAATVGNDCKAVIGTFEYPNDLNIMDSLSYKCSGVPIPSNYTSDDLNLLLSFNDKNYALYTYDFRTRLLYDKQNGLYLCIKRSIDSEFFLKESIYGIYFLGDNALPLFYLHQYPNNSKLQIIKLYYDNKHPALYGYVVKLNNEQLELDTLNYENIILLAKDLYKNNFESTNKFVSFETPHFKKVPLWTDN